MARPCPHCGEKSIPGDEPCPQCGYLPGVSGGLEHEAERRIATVLFVDLVGASGLGERLDVESLQDIAEAFYQEASTVVGDLGGTVGRYAGDALMALFGIPKAHEDDVDRALTAATTLIQRVRALSRRLAPTYGEQLAVHCGINTGELVVPASGAIELGKLAADTVNVAARLQEAAGPGEVLVSERTARASSAHAFEDRGEFELRGRLAPVRVFAIADGSDSPRRSPRRGRIFGRSDELTRLHAYFERSVYSRFPRLTVMLGEAGIGKTRLAEEFAASLADVKKPPIVFQARCLPFGEKSALSPLSEMVRAMERLPGEPSELLAALARQQHEAVGDGVNTKQLDREVRQAWCIYLNSVARLVPVVLIIEDLHWADGKLLDLMDDLLSHCQGPLLLVGTARPGFEEVRASWLTDDGPGDSLRVGPLAAEDATAMLNALAGRRPLAPDVVEPLLRMANGNPLFLANLLDQLIDERRIVATPSEWVWAQGGEVGLPDSVLAVLAARIDLLSPFDALTLRYAAAVGQSFWAGALALVHGAPLARVAEALDRLTVHNLIVAVDNPSLPDQMEYAFTHVLTQEVAYAGLTHRERAAAHDLTYRWLASVNVDSQDVVDLLARHAASAFEEGVLDPRLSESERAGLRVRALAALTDAADAARAALSLDKADQLAQRALALTVTPEERATVMEEWGRIALYGYAGDDAWNRLREAIDLRRASGASKGTLADLCALALETPIRWPGTMRAPPAEEDVARYMELGLASAGPGDSEARTQLLLLKGFWHHAYSPDRAGERLLGQDEALAAAQEAADMAHRLGRADLESAALDGVAASWIPRGRYDRAREATLRRLALVPQLSDDREVGDIHAMCGWTNFHIGNYREAADYADAGVALIGEEVPSVALHCLVWRSLARFHLGEWDGQLADLDVCRELLGSRVDEPPHFASPMFAAAALTHDLRAETAEADAILDMLARLDERADAVDRDAAPLARWASWVARILANRGQFEEARALLEVTRWRRGTRLGLLLHASCMIAAESADWARAPTLVATARAEAQRGGLLALAAAADHLDGTMRSETGDHAGAVATLRSAVDGFGRCEARWEQALARLALGTTLARLGESEAATEQLAAANAEFNRLGVQLKPWTEPALEDVRTLRAQGSQGDSVHP